MQNFAIYFSEIDKQGQKMDFTGMSRKDQTIKVVKGTNMLDALTNFGVLYPNLVAIGVAKY